MIWVKDSVKFKNYSEKLQSIVKKHEITTERLLSPITTSYPGTYAQNLSKPDMISVVYYKNKEIYNKFINDPDYIELSSLRKESVDFIGIGGQSVEGEINKGKVAKRLYMIEFSYYSDSDGSNYKDYEDKSIDFYKRNGVELERRIKPKDLTGNIITLPSIVNILYIKSGDSSQLQKDPEHHNIQGYFRQAVSNSIWIEGKAAYFNME
jgi:uncharacterized protein (DUF1330 family)